MSWPSAEKALARPCSRRLRKRSAIPAKFIARVAQQLHFDEQNKQAGFPKFPINGTSAVLTFVLRAKHLVGLFRKDNTLFLVSGSRSQCFCRSCLPHVFTVTGWLFASAGWN
jgi:hypothetical protein